MLGYGFVENVLFIGTSEEMLELAAKGADSPLAANELFQATVKPLPADSRGYAYVDVEQSVRIISRTLGDDERGAFNTTIRPYLESVRAIGMAAGPMDENGLLRGVLFVRTENR